MHDALLRKARAEKAIEDATKIKLNKAVPGNR